MPIAPTGSVTSNDTSTLPWVEPGARLAGRLAMPVSPDTLLRMARSISLPEAISPGVIGIDECAWRKGRSYGTIIVDLERNALADLLPDRDASSVAHWLRRHPGVEVVVRDRAEVYGEGARQGAPKASHVADRWHLLRNLSVALQAVAGQHHGAIPSAAGSVLKETAETKRLKEASARPLTAGQKRSLAIQSRRRDHHAELVRLHRAGASISGLARSLGLDAKTVRRWLREGRHPCGDNPANRARLIPM